MKKLSNPPLQQYDFPCVTARYHRAPPIEEYADNPLIACLGPVPSERHLRIATTRLPRYDPAERTANRTIRRLRLERVKRVNLGLPRVAELAETFNASMLESLACRRPFTPESNRVLQSLYNLRFRDTAGTDERFKALSTADNTAQFTTAVIGTAGSGKTVALNHIDALYPKCIHHPSIGGKDGAIWQIPVLKVEMPTKGFNLQTLSHAILLAFDERFPDGNYFKQYIRPRMNGEQRFLTALSLFRIHCVGQLIVDEAQNSNGSRDAKSLAEMIARPQLIWSGRSPLTQLLIMATNRVHMGLTLAGTAELKQHLGSRLSGLRRLAGLGIRPWTPLELGERSSRGKSEFETLLKCLWRYWYVRKPCPLTTAFKARMLLYSYGIPDIVVKLFQSVQWAAIRSGKEEVTVELLDRVAHTEYKDLIAVTAALRARNNKAMAIIRSMSDVAAEFGVDPTSIHTNDLGRFSKADYDKAVKEVLQYYEYEDADAEVPEPSREVQLREEPSEDERERMVEELMRAKAEGKAEETDDKDMVDRSLVAATLAEIDAQ